MLNELKQIEQKLREKLQAQKTSYTGSLYHYCPAEALNEILSSKSIRFSDARFMNDASETNYIYYLLMQYIFNEEATITDSFMNFLIKNTPAIGYDIYRRTNNTAKDQVYIACFSTNQDNLALWNYYTKSQNSIGYNIEFKHNPFTKELNNTTFINGAVIYEKEKQYELLKQIISTYNNCWERHEEIKKYYSTQNGLFKKDKSSSLDTFLMSYLSTLNLYNIFFKPEAYKVEEEYRFAIFNTKDENWQTRIVNGFFIPYFSEEIQMNKICSINISPCNEPNLYKSGVSALLQQISSTDKKNKIKNTVNPDLEIGISAIPKRY